MRQLEMLLAVAEHGSFAAAAGALRLTPSAVSQQMSALERAVGHNLFERSTRGVVLTEAASLLTTSAQSIRGELTRTQRLHDTLDRGKPPTLTIASFTSAGEQILAPALVKLTEQFGHPINVTVLEAEPDDAVRAVKEGRADLAITYRLGEAPQPDTSLRYRPLGADPLRLVVPTRGRFAQAGKVTWPDLVGESWICGWGALGAVFDRFAQEYLLKRAGLATTISCRLSSALVWASRLFQNSHSPTDTTLRRSPSTRQRADTLACISRRASPKNTPRTRLKNFCTSRWR